MIVCLVILRALGRGGFTGFIGFGTGLVVVGTGLVVEAGVGVVGVEVAGCFPWRRRVTGMNNDAADA